MSWRYSAKKGFIVRKGGAQKKSAIENEVKRLRSEGYRVRVYQVR